MGEDSLSKRAVSGKIINIPNFREGDYVRLKGDLLTRHERPKDRFILSPKGTIGVIIKADISTPPNSHESYRVRFANEMSEIGLVIEDADVAILERTELDSFDRAWLDIDYAKARELYDSRE